LIHKIAQVGLDIKHIRRSNRTGYKAGALKEGLPKENYCYFDADFVPQKTGSKPFFIRIQNWCCSNPLGTSKPQLFNIKIQAFALDAHFTLEQVGRNSKLHLSILMELACGESNVFWMRGIGDTTGRLDLLSRSVKNWKYSENGYPAELPAIISATRSQQFRWNRRS
jgi:hypothetical protein